MQTRYLAFFNIFNVLDPIVTSFGRAIWLQGGLSVVHSFLSWEPGRWGPLTAFLCVILLGVFAQPFVLGLEDVCADAAHPAHSTSDTTFCDTMGAGVSDVQNVGIFLGLYVRSLATSTFSSSSYPRLLVSTHSSTCCKPGTPGSPSSAR